MQNSSWHLQFVKEQSGCLERNPFLYMCMFVCDCLFASNTQCPILKVNKQLHDITPWRLQLKFVGIPLNPKA